MKRWHWFSIILLLAILFGWYKFSTLNHYQTAGEVKLSGLSAPVKVIRDEKGMPYIFAEDLADLLRAQGYIMAQDRLFQMHLTRLLSQGRISELAGEKGKSLDLQNRTIGFYRQALQHKTLLDAESLRELQHFSDGINAYILENQEEHPLEFSLASLSPELWKPEDTIAIMYYLGWRSAANLKTEIISQMLIEKLGPEKFMEIFPTSTNPDDLLPEGSDKALFQTNGPHPLNPPLPDESGQAIRGERDLMPFPKKAFFSPLLQGEGPGVRSKPAQTFSSVITAKNLLADTLLMSFFNNAGAPLALGSNNWTAGAEMSPGGKPIVVNDPHLDSRILPGVFYACGLFSPDIRTVGAIPPGIPGLLVGRNQFVASGVTNAYGDAQDLYIETIDPQNPDHYLENGQSFPFEIIEETLKIKDENEASGFREEKLRIRKTHRGPVISGVLPALKTNRVFSLRWAPFETMASKLALDFLLKAKSAKELRETLRFATTLHLNVVFADVQGNIAWQTTGRLPIRAAGNGAIPLDANQHPDDWVDWLPFEAQPGQFNSEKGWLGTANHNTVKKDYQHYYSSYFSPYYRYQRMKELLNAPGKKSVDDHWQFMRDDLNVMARRLAPIFAKTFATDPETEDLGKILTNWDYRDHVKSVATTIFQTSYRHLAALTYQDKLGDELTKTMLTSWYFWQERLEQMIVSGNAPWFDDTRTEDRQETLADMILLAGKKAQQELSAQLGDDPAAWQWEKVHQIVYSNPIRRSGFGKEWLGDGPYPMGGSGETLYRARYDFFTPEEIGFSAAVRMVADLSDDEKVAAVLNGGISARTFHPHQKDQIPAYHSGEKLYWWFSNAQIMTHKQSELWLQP